VDERFNGGGSVADYYIEALTRQPIAWWAMRYGQDLKTPSASIQGPKVMLIDETAGSGGDLLPWMFRRFKVGRSSASAPGAASSASSDSRRSWTAPSSPPRTSRSGHPRRASASRTSVFPRRGGRADPGGRHRRQGPQLEKAIAIVMEELRRALRRNRSDRRSR